MLVAAIPPLMTGCFSEHGKLHEHYRIYEAYNQRFPISELADRSRAILSRQPARGGMSVYLVPLAPSDFGDLWAKMQEAWIPWGDLEIEAILSPDDGGALGLTIEMSKTPLFLTVISRDMWMDGDNCNPGVFPLDANQILRVAPGMYIMGDEDDEFRKKDASNR